MKDKKTIRRNTVINDDVDIKAWRKRLSEVISAIDDKSILSILVSIDPFFDTKTGMVSYSNVLGQRAGIVKTARVVLILEGYVKKKTTPKSYMKKIKSAAL